MGSPEIIRLSQRLRAERFHPGVHIGIECAPPTRVPVNACPEIGLVKPEATYFAWMDMRGSGLNDPFNALLEAGVELFDGERFGAPGFLRLNFASPGNTNEEALRRIGSILSQ